MATAIVDGITTHYEVVGSGPAVLMFSPGGFDATLDKWTTQSIYSRIKPVDHLSTKYTCIIFDRREAGQSGGRVECISWAHYVKQGKGLLEHLKIQRAHIMGACMGVCPAVAFGVRHPETTDSVLLYWPVGGAKYRIRCHSRFAEHLTYVQQHGLEGVVALVKRERKSFGQDPRCGPWATPIGRDPSFADSYVSQDVNRYTHLVNDMVRGLFDRDTAPGAEPEDLLRLDVRALIVPGNDESHATSAARYLEEHLRYAEYWDVGVEDQTAQTAPHRMLDFLESVA